MVCCVVSDTLTMQLLILLIRSACGSVMVATVAGLKGYKGSKWGWASVYLKPDCDGHLCGGLAESWKGPSLWGTTRGALRQSPRKETFKVNKGPYQGKALIEKT